MFARSWGICRPSTPSRPPTHVRSRGASFSSRCRQVITMRARMTPVTSRAVVLFVGAEKGS